MVATKKATGMPVIHPLSDSEPIRAQAEHIESLFDSLEFQKKLATGSYNRGVSDALKCLDMSLGLVDPKHEVSLQVVKIMMQSLMEVSNGEC